MARSPPGKVTAVYMDAPPSGLSGWRRRGAAAFIVLWIAVQALVPLWQKFPPPDFHYRWARYSWGMFSSIGPRYEVRLFRTRGTGAEQPIPEMPRYVRGYRSPEPMRMRDGYTYVASVQWLGGQRADLPERSELRAQAAE